MRTPVPVRRRSLPRTTAAVVGVVAIVAGATSAGARTPPNPNVAADAAAVLAGVKGASLLVADPASGCMAGPSPQPVAIRSERILVRTAERDDGVVGALAANPSFAAAGFTGTPSIVARLSPPGPGGLVPVVVVDLGLAAVHAPQVLTLVRGLRAAGLEASPDYALSPSGGPIGMWPYGPPEPTGAPLPAPRRARIGRGVTIALYDTGVPIDRFGANAPANIDELSGIDKLDRNADGVADLPYDGHTIAVASVVNTLAPAADVYVVRIMDDSGVATDSSAATSVISSFSDRFVADFPPGFAPDVLLMPFGTPACDGLPPLALQAVTAGIVASGRSLIVASAGNRGEDRPFYPAAFDGVVAVGSLDLTGDRDGSAWTSPTRAGPRSAFSNYGPWVDAWAGGERLVTNHIAGLSFYDGGPMLDGVAEVSGTSYAAPAVAALIAEGVSRTGRPAGWVWRHLLRPSGTRCPASGGGVAVALTALDEPFSEQAEHVRRSPC